MLAMKTQGSQNIEILSVRWICREHAGIELRYLKGKPFQMVTIDGLERF